ncbi:glycosyl hydrolase family 18 protein [Frigoribacterium sp. PvP032]|uniref:glycosyl hydrolase family 18 protein n=1 Tax=Frigoribacterium sp. PvP032 TaxID=2806589 RepID=UPI001AEB4FF2|nr:glycosyl hydrolase family 18 protein [Frigoribacterium sp. PvP032]MBP1189560.1 spore germination protein YaaH [Frigoribacterium sp. PvP032]
MTPTSVRTRSARVAVIALLALVLGGCTSATGVSSSGAPSTSSSGAALDDDAAAADAEPADAVATAPTLDVTGFVLEGDDLGLVDASAASLDVVSVDGVLLAADGASVSAPSLEAEAQRDAAHAQGLQAQLLVSNYDDALGDFSTPIATALLTSQANRSAVVADLVSRVQTGGWDSLMIDLESLTRTHAAGLTAFAGELRTAVGPDVRLDLAMQASTTVEGYAERGYDVPALALSLDHLALMAYDQHGLWDPDTPGPVGALDWTIDSLAALTELAPTDQVVLGVGGYGYRWGGTGPAATGPLTDEEARDRVEDAGGDARWDSTAAEQTATLDDGEVLWWSDARSLDTRVSLARGLGLAGVAVWSLGLSDPIELDAD